MSQEQLSNASSVIRKQKTRGCLHVGTLVRVKDEPELLQTLDDGQALDGLAFTAEMRASCGRIYRVLAHVGRINVAGTGMRRMREGVILEGARCDGSAHGGCGRACYLLFKPEWLDIVEDSELREPEPVSPHTVIPYEANLPCQGQGTVMLEATDPFSPWDIRCYITDLTTGTNRFRDVVFGLTMRMTRRWNARQKMWKIFAGNRGLADLSRLFGTLLNQNTRFYWGRILGKGGPKAPSQEPTPPPAAAPLNLQPGELVEVRSEEEILATLDATDRSRGLKFYGSMLRFCGKRYRVRSRVESLMDEITSTPRTVKGTVLLEGSTCDGVPYFGCPRACHWLWRESWLKRVENEDSYDEG